MGYTKEDFKMMTALNAGKFGKPEQLTFFKTVYNVKGKTHRLVKLILKAEVAILSQQHPEYQFGDLEGSPISADGSRVFIITYKKKVYEHRG